MPVAASYDNYISKLLYINNLYYIAMKYTLKKYTSKEPPASYCKEEDTMDWEPTQATAAQKGGQKKRAQWVSQEELDKCHQERNCLHCGSPNHYVADCELLPARCPDGPKAGPDRQQGVRQPRPARSTPAPKKTTAAKAKVEEVEEEEDEEYSSGIKELN